jgi:hypothetical protein
MVTSIGFISGARAAGGVMGGGVPPARQATGGGMSGAAGHGGPVHGGTIGPQPSAGHPGHGGATPGAGHGATPGAGHRSFNRNAFFGGHDYNYWRHNQKHYYWNGNTWIYGVEPPNFVTIPVPISSCPDTPSMFGGDANACFFSCVDGGYDPISVCDVCCGTNY